MEMYKFYKLSPDKISIMFTWDDNFQSHYEIIAPLFEAYGFLCTFYINPGEPNFNIYSKGYAHLSDLGFEIGSHGYTHHHFTNLTNNEFFMQLSYSLQAIENLCGKKPLTFAFPHHDFTPDMLDRTKDIYLETRNTLCNTKRFSLKTSSLLSHISETIEDAIENRYNIVFSGHGINSNKYKDCGYEPISLDMLDKILQMIKGKQKLSVETFLQGTIKAFIKNSCTFNKNGFWISDELNTYIQKYKISKERFLSLL